MSKTELQSAVETVVAMAGCSGRVTVENDYLGMPVTDRVSVQLVGDFNVGKDQLTTIGRQVRRALLDAGFKASKASIDWSYHMGAKADCFYNFRIGI